MAQAEPSFLSNSINELDIKSILLVDDDRDLCDALKLLLETRNFVVTVVENGRDALHEVMSLDFDVIVCDLLMPHMPGDMFYLAVQKVKPDLCRRFIFITGYGKDPKFDFFLNEVKGEVLFKPVRTDDLVRTIGMVIQRTQREA